MKFFLTQGVYNLDAAHYIAHKRDRGQRDVSRSREPGESAATAASNITLCRCQSLVPSYLYILGQSCLDLLCYSTVLSVSTFAVYIIGSKLTVLKYEMCSSLFKITQEVKIKTLANF